MSNVRFWSQKKPTKTEEKINTSLQYKFKKIFEEGFNDEITTDIVFNFEIRERDYDCVIFRQEKIIIIEQKNFQYDIDGNELDPYWYYYTGSKGEAIQYDRWENPFTQVERQREKMINFSQEFNQDFIKLNSKDFIENTIRFHNNVISGLLVTSDTKVGPMAKNLINKYNWFFIEYMDSIEDYLKSVLLEEPVKLNYSSDELLNSMILKETHVFTPPIKRDKIDNFDIDVKPMKNMDYAAADTYNSTNPNLIKLDELINKIKETKTAYNFQNNYSLLNKDQSNKQIIRKKIAKKNLNKHVASLKAKSINKEKEPRKFGLPNGEGEILYNNGNKYNGFLRDWQPNGEGTMEFENGVKLKSNWLNGEPGSNAKIYYKKGIYEGQINKMQPNGHGIFYFNNGHNLECEWVNGKAGNEGFIYQNGEKIKYSENDYRTYELSYLNKDVYKGEIKAGLPNGNGIMYYKNGAKLECEWSYGKPGNTGKIIYLNGCEYSGCISDGVPDGSGILKINNFLHLEGDWIKGKLNENVLICFSGIGQFNGIINEQNENQKIVIFNSNENKIDYTIENGNISKLCSIYYKNGDIYTGELKLITPEGKGILLHSNGTKYEGQFRNGLPDGDGVYTGRLGKAIAGKWEKGKRKIFFWSFGK